MSLSAVGVIGKGVGRWAGCAVIAAGLTAGAAGCGYSTGGSGYQWKSVYRQDVQTVHVPIFKNTTYHRGIEFSLTKAVIHKLELKTPYKVASADTADTVLEGEITSVRVNPLSEDDRTTLPQEQLMTVTMNFLWKDLRSGRVLAQRRAFEQAVAYYPTLGEGHFVASQDAVERLALAVVRELQAEW